MKKWLGIVTVAALYCMILAPAAQAEKVLKLAHVYAPKTPFGLAGEKFSEIIEKKSKGSIKVKHYPGGQLGTAKEIFASMQMGTLDLVLGSVAIYGWVKGGETLQIASLPYIFDSSEKARKVFNSPLFMDIYSRAEKSIGIKIYKILGERSPRAVNTVKVPVWSPEDIKGLKIRVSTNPMLVEAFTAWGARPVPLPMGDLFTALQQGVVDGQDNGIDFIEPNSYQEVTKYFAFTDHVYDYLGWGASSRVWKKLTPGEQKLFEEAAEEAGRWEIEYFRNFERESMKRLMDKGMKFTLPNKDAFQAAAKDVYLKFEGKIWPQGLVEKIRSMQKGM